MNKNSNSAINVIAYAIENDTNSLKDLLKRNGIFTDSKTSKDELQYIVVASLAKSKSFQNEFKNWVLNRSQISDYANGDGTFQPIQLPSSATNYQFGQSGSLNLTSTSTSQTFGGVTIGDKTKDQTPNLVAKDSPWKLSVNEILDFAKTGMNNFVLVQQSKSDRDIANAALEAKRLELQTSAKGGSKSTNNKTIYVVLGVLAFVGIVGGIIYYNRKK